MSKRADGMSDSESAAQIPMKWVGPIAVTGPVLTESVRVPLATLERPLWPSTNRGAKVSRACGGIRVVVADERMARSVVFEARTAVDACRVRDALLARRAELEAVVARTTRFGRLIDLHSQIVGRLFYLRIELHTADAAGHNMVTMAADRVMEWVLGEYPDLSYVSISANYCCDKKVSAVNGILGRGRYVVAEAVIPDAVCESLLKTTPARVADLNVKKNLIGSILAGGVRSANAHYANMLLGFYLATGQDAANIVEGSQGITHAEAVAGGLYMSVTLPSIIVGSVGSGKREPYVVDAMTRMGCMEAREPGANARRLAALCGAAVWCGELSLLAAQTNRGELMRAHVSLERRSDG